MKKPVIRIISNLPRSGGTLLGRCVGCMDGITLLSEIHPRDVNSTARSTRPTSCHGLISREEHETHNCFMDAIQLVYERASHQSSSLVIRDQQRLTVLVDHAFDVAHHAAYMVLIVLPMERLHDVEQHHLLVGAWLAQNRVFFSTFKPFDRILAGIPLDQKITAARSASCSL